MCDTRDIGDNRYHCLHYECPHSSDNYPKPDCRECPTPCHSVHLDLIVHTNLDTGNSSIMDKGHAPSAAMQIFTRCALSLQE
jgi:hypothetical protein